MNLIVTVNKDELLEVMAKNRKSHAAKFKKAEKGYKRAVIRELDVRLKQYKKGEEPGLYFNLPKPTDNTSDYDEAMAMIKMSTQNEIELGQQLFNQYVLDQWGWSQQFNTIASGYCA